MSKATTHKIIKMREEIQLAKKNYLQDEMFLSMCSKVGVHPTIGLWGNEDENEGDIYACSQCQKAGHYLPGHHLCFNGVYEEVK